MEPYIDLFTQFIFPFLSFLASIIRHHSSPLLLLFFFFFFLPTIRRTGAWNSAKSMSSSISYYIRDILSDFPFVIFEKLEFRWLWWEEEAASCDGACYETLRLKAPSSQPIGNLKFFGDVIDGVGVVFLILACRLGKPIRFIELDVSV